ncbi:glycosyltransferase [Oxyplasma meridianum]|uniref:Glycosyltransferase n=1 Tax=Oxyplasma meridianum TaxID=3073602 RepID=A0AAX4NE87_9ARCH
MSIPESGISIIVTVKNEEKNIGRLLESLSKQDCLFEIVIVDSESKDRTADVVNSFKDRIQYITYIRKRSTRGEGRNIGVSNAKFDYVAFTDGDTVAGDQWGCRMLESLKKYDIVAGRTVQKGSDHYSRLKRVELLMDGKEITAPSANLGYRKKLFNELGGFDETMITAEDIDLNLRAVMKGATWKNDDSCIIYNYTRDDFAGFMKQAFWNGYGRRQLKKKHGSAMKKLASPSIFTGEYMNFLYVMRFFPAFAGYISCMIFSP